MILHHCSCANPSLAIDSNSVATVTFLPLPAELAPHRASVDNANPNSRKSHFDWRPDPRRTLKTLAIGLLLSLLLHTALVVFVPAPEKKIDAPIAGGVNAMQMVIAPPAQPDTAPPPQAMPKPIPIRPQQPRILAVPTPSPNMPAIPAVPDEQLQRAPERILAPTETAPVDFMAALNARRAKRIAAEDSLARENAAARAGEREMTAEEKATAGFNRNMQSLGRGRDGTSGVFQIQSKGTRYAAFSFRGWTTDRSNAKYQVIEVDAGTGGDVDLAIVRRMIELIRTHYQGDFNWESSRLGRVVVLSARKDDTAGLEAFLMREFFG